MLRWKNSFRCMTDGVIMVIIVTNVLYGNLKTWRTHSTSELKVSIWMFYNIIATGYG